MAGQRLSEAVILAYAELSHDHNPLHVDPAAAAASPFGGIVAHGFLLLTGPLNALNAEPDYPKRLECRFVAPGRPGETLETEISSSGNFRVRSGERDLVIGSLRSGSQSSE